jgi:general secretion pathway protein C
MIFLPTSGVEQAKVSKVKPLFYRVKLASKAKQIKATTPTPIVKTPTIGTMKGITLLALYNASDALVVTVEKAKKTKVLSKGENIDGFVLSSAGTNYAIFTKNKKEFKLVLLGSKLKSSIGKKSTKKATIPSQESKKNAITESDYGTGKVVSKGLLASYTKDIDKVWKDIGIGEYKVNNQLQGFKVNFIKKGSDFEKLGLKKGDILKSINGQELNSYNAAFSFYKEMESVENLTISIKRNNQDMELEYEIQ